jgi:hypothetical protein
MFDEADMRYSSTRHDLHDGDVIIRRTGGASRPYTLSTLQEAPQIACRPYDEAIARASRFARPRLVDVWATDDDRAFVRVIQCRPVGRESAGPRGLGARMTPEPPASRRRL